MAEATGSVVGGLVYSTRNKWVIGQELLNVKKKSKQKVLHKVVTYNVVIKPHHTPFFMRQ